jgi:hypothetical protein
MLCSACLSDKDASQFTSSKRQGLTKLCASCRHNRTAYAHRRKAEDPGKYNLQAALRRYGLSFEAYQELLNKQEGCCGICGIKFEGSIHIDHCHSTRRVRGLLCLACNLGLGQFRDSPQLLRQAIDYLNG